MLKSTSAKVTLPDGDVVEVSRTPLPWWGEKNASGYIHPDDIAPDLDNPRKRMNPTRKAELDKSVRARGVRQQIVVVPRHLVPWARVAPEHKQRYFVAVSGHRRRDSASEANLGAVPIKVAIYASEKDHRMDMSLLNKGQDDLTPLEEGYEIVELRKLNWTVDELCESFGLALPQYYGRINLTKLHPDLQALLDDELPREVGLSVTVGGQLGGVKAFGADVLEGLFTQYAETVDRASVTDIPLLDDESDDSRRFILQKLLFAIIKKRKLGSNQAIELIRDLVLKNQPHGAAGARVRRFEPHRRMDLINALINGVVNSVVIDWPMAELTRIYGNATKEGIEETIKRMKQAHSLFGSLITTLERIASQKKATNPEVERLMARHKTPAQV